MVRRLRGKLLLLGNDGACLERCSRGADEVEGQFEGPRGDRRG